MKRLIVFLTALLAIVWIPQAAFSAMGTMSPKSKDIDIQFFGSVKTYPTFLSDVDLNDDDTRFDKISDESGTMSDHNIRNEVRIGWSGKGQNWDFLVILETDFNFSQANADRGGNGARFGVEKLNLRYDFGPAAIKAGWNSRFLDIMTGGVLYGDDHPYIGFEGKCSERFSWEALYLVVQDDTTTDSIGAIDADTLDWRVYTLKGIYKLSNGFVISPFYAYSDNDENHSANAKVHYLGAEAYGKLGIITPRLEFVYATGDTDTWTSTGLDYDISAWAAFASVEAELSKSFIPYAGITYMTGDDDANDSDIEAFNGITNIARYTPTFGMENAFIHRSIPVLGSVLYSNNFAMLGGTSPGYGGVANSSTGDSPGLISFGIGAKGRMGKLSYKAQILFMQFQEEGAIEDYYGTSIDSYVGTEYDLQLTYKFNKHFSLGNCLSVFDPGDAVEDLRGPGYDDIGFIDTIELKWTW